MRSRVERVVREAIAAFDASGTLVSDTLDFVLLHRCEDLRAGGAFEREGVGERMMLLGGERDEPPVVLEGERSMSVASLVASMGQACGWRPLRADFGEEGAGRDMWAELPKLFQLGGLAARAPRVAAEEGAHEVATCPSPADPRTSAPRRGCGGR